MYESLTRYLPAIEESDDYGTWIIDREHAGTMDDPKQMPYVDYSRQVTDLENAISAFVVGHAELGLTRYPDILKENDLSWDSESMEGADASTLDARAVLALLVGAVRAERFCDGALLRFFKQGCIARWLRRLREIDSISDE